VPREITYSQSISASARSSNSDTKEQVFDMPISTNYGSTGRPPGKYLRHSLKKMISNISEFSQPPFHICSIGTTNNNNINNNNIYYNNGGAQMTINYNISAYDDNKEADTAHSIHRTDKINKKWFDLNQTISNNNNNNNKNNNIDRDNNNYSICYDNGGNSDEKGISLTAVNYNTSTYDDNKEANSAHSIHRKDKIIERFDSISNNNNNITNNDSISTPTTDTSTATTTTTTTTRATINYNNTSTYDDNKEADTAHNIHRTDKTNKKWFDLNQTISSNNNNNNNTTTPTINNNTSTYDDDNKANTAYSIHRTDKIKWFNISNNNNNNNNNNNKLETSSFSYSTNNNNNITCYYDNGGIQTTINYNTSTYDDNKEADTAQRIHRTDKIKWFNTANNNKYHHHHQQQQQQQQHYHGKQRHQFHLEQQQKHQHLKQGHHNAERMAISIILKLTLVAWDMWTFRNGF
jgi:hypothetical protein